MSFYTLHEGLHSKSRKHAWIVGMRLSLRMISFAGQYEHDDMLPELRTILTVGVLCSGSCRLSAIEVRELVNKVRQHSIKYQRGSKHRDPQIVETPVKLATQSLLKSVLAKRNFKDHILVGAEQANRSLLGHVNERLSGAAARVLLSPENSVLDEIDADLALVKKGWTVGDIADAPLFSRPMLHIHNRPSEIFNDQTPSPWGFWREWYQGFMDGNPIDWELQRRLALLDDEVWMAGPKFVAEKIDAMRAQHDLLQAANDVDKQLKIDRHADALPRRGHNNPPYMIDEPWLAERIPVVQLAVKTLKEQSQSATPEKAEVEQALSTITRWQDAVLAWLGRKADLAVDTAIKWAIPAGGGYLILNPKQLQALIEAGKAFLPFLN